LTEYLAQNLDGLHNKMEFQAQIAVVSPERDSIMELNTVEVIREEKTAITEPLTLHFDGSDENRSVEC
jgi:hypothetical protein